MPKDPAFLFYSSDFLSGVSDLTFEERGQYITMLCVQHQKGHISSKWLSINIPNASSDVLSKFTKDGDGNYQSIRLVEEIEKRKSFTGYKIAAATLGGLINAHSLSKQDVRFIRGRFNIQDFQDYEKEEIKQMVRKWFKHMLNLLENEDENEDINKDESIDETKGGIVKGGNYHLTITTLIMEYYGQKIKRGEVEQAMKTALEQIELNGITDPVQFLKSQIDSYFAFCTAAGQKRKHLDGWLREGYYGENWIRKMEELRTAGPDKYAKQNNVVNNAFEISKEIRKKLEQEETK